MEPKKKKTQKRTAAKPFPAPLAKRLVLKCAHESHALRPMIFWEMAKVWDWMELATDDSGRTSTDALIYNLSNLHIYFKNSEVKDNSRSVALVLKVTMPTQKEFRRLCQKYGYDPDISDTEEA